MIISKPLKWLIIVIFVAAGCGVYAFARMYREDIKELKAFLAAYDRFDAAMAEVVIRGRSDDVVSARKALSDLRTRGTMRLSSLIKNDGELMAQARQIAELAEREVPSREGSPGEEQIAQGEKRRAAFARIEDLAGTNERKRNESKKGDSHGG